MFRSMGGTRLAFEMDRRLCRAVEAWFGTLVGLVRGKMAICMEYS